MKVDDVSLSMHDLWNNNKLKEEINLFWPKIKWNNVEGRILIEFKALKTYFITNFNIEIDLLVLINYQTFFITII